MAFVGVEDQAGARAIVLDGGLWVVILEVGQDQGYSLVPLVCVADAGANDLELVLVIVLGLAWVG